MRLFVLSVVALLAGLYAYAAFDVFREERRAQDPDALVALVSGPARHPEANLRHLRTSFASGEYSNELKPYLDRASSKLRRNCLPLWVDQGDGGVVGSTKD